MAKVKVNIELDPDAPLVIFHLPEVKSALTKEAQAIASRANAMSAGFRTKEGKDPETGEERGGKRPKYAALPARDSAYVGSIALVVEKNYAAILDNHKNNTLLKAKG